MSVVAYHWIHLAAHKAPDQPAIQQPERSLTYAELSKAAIGAAGALESLGVRGGDRVAIALPPSADFVVALHGCVLIGAAAVPIDLRLNEAERARRMAGAEVVVSEPLEPQPIRRPTSSLGGDSVVAVMHTSGTTAAPKPVTLTYGNFLASALGSAVMLGLDQKERWLCPMPLTHVGGLSIPIRSSIYATTAVLHGRFDTEAVLSDLMDPERRITVVSLVPTMLARLLDAGLQRPPTLRWVLLGGGPIAPGLLEQAGAAGVPVAPTYGMTETCSQIATFGWALPGVDMRLAADGEVLVRGPIVSTGALAGDGWLHTGDLGRFDNRNRLEIVGRQSDTIVTGGENVAPAEVEAILLEHPAVADAAVHPRPDPEWGEAVIATVVLRDGMAVTPDDLKAHCTARLASFKVPKAVEFADALPRTPSGKLLRRQL
ncbi:MAG: AMP-binding protein [Solirubrobacterales bacterium]|nr:AMP-binding protein [Solirubrobacterales bacterium]